MQHGAEPQVDVIIPCYNKGAFLAEAVECVLGQTYCHVSVIVVDDGSTDNSVEVARGFGDRICLLTQANAGVSAARNTGILAARGEFLQFLDADDYMERDMLETLVAAARETPGGAVYHGSYQRVDVAGHPLFPPESEPMDADAFHSLLVGNHFACHAAIVRRTAFAKAGLFDASLRSAEDWDMWIRLAAAGCEFVAAPQALAYYRCCPGSLTRHFDRMWQTSHAVLRKSLTYHRDCALCRSAAARGRARLRRYFFEMLVADLYAVKARQGMAASLAKAAREIRRDPGLAPWLLREMGPYLRGEHARGHRKDDADQAPQVPAPAGPPVPPAKTDPVGALVHAGAPGPRAEGESTVELSR